MNPTERMLVHLLDCAVHERAPDAALAQDVDWQALFMLAQAHKIDAMLLDTVLKLSDAQRIPDNIMIAWQENAMLTMMGQAMLTDQLHRLLAAFDAAGMQAVVLKGVALKPLYPQPDLRTMNDADLLVDASNIRPARELMAREGYAPDGEEPGVYIYVGAEGLRVELHEQLFNRTAYGFLSRLDEGAMFPMSLARRDAVWGGEAWVYPPLEHALFMLCHMAKHMITTGFGLRQTMDFILYAQAHDDTMDWDAFWKAAGDLGLAGFASAILALGEQSFQLPAGRWKRGAKAAPGAADALLGDLLDAGVFGHRTEERKRSAAVVYRAYEAEDGDRGRIRRALFPPASTLKAPYLYAVRHRALLPVAWVHRGGNYLIGLLRGRHRYSEAAGGLAVADERLRLLDRLGLRDAAARHDELEQSE